MNAGVEPPAAFRTALACSAQVVAAAPADQRRRGIVSDGRGRIHFPLNRLECGGVYRQPQFQTKYNLHEVQTYRFWVFEWFHGIRWLVAARLAAR